MHNKTASRVTFQKFRKAEMEGRFGYLPVRILEEDWADTRGARTPFFVVFLDGAPCFKASLAGIALATRVGSALAGEAL